MCVHKYMYSTSKMLKSPSQLTFLKNYLGLSQIYCQIFWPHDGALISIANIELEKIKIGNNLKKMHR